METKPKSINAICDYVVEQFIASDYPLRTFDLSWEGVITVHIRMPPGFPMVALPNLTDKDYFTKLSCQFPCLERIEISPEFQGKGLFKELVSALSKTKDVKAVVVGNVANRDLALYLTAKCAQAGSGWSHYRNGPLPTFCYSSTGFVLASA